MSTSWYLPHLPVLLLRMVCSNTDLLNYCFKLAELRMSDGVVGSPMPNAGTL